MSDLQPLFDEAVAQSKALAQRPDNATLLRLYALYKQATQGDNAEDKPGFSDLVARAKWDAWHKLEGTPPNDAMQRYIDLVRELRTL